MAPAQSDPLPEPSRVTIQQFLEHAREWGETREVRVSGVVTLSLPDHSFFLQDETVGVYAHHLPAEALAVGTSVEVTGYPAFTGLRPTLRRCTVVIRGPGVEPPPRQVRAEDLIAGGHHMELVRVRGRLGPGAGFWTPLTDGAHSVLARWDSVTGDDLALEVAPDSLVELTGVCTVAPATASRPARAFLHLRRQDDLRILAPPPWWTPRRIVGALGTALAALILALLWAGLLRREVRRRTGELEDNLRRIAALEVRYRLLFEANPNPLWVHDRETGRFLAANQAALRQYGYDAAAFLNLSVRDLWPSRAVPVPPSSPTSEPETPTGPICGIHRKRNGNEFEAEITRHSLEFGGRAAELVMAIDITSRRQAEAERRDLDEKLQQTQKLESLGLLAGGIAHDFNNLLTVVLGNLSLARMDATAVSVRSPIEEAEKATRRAADLARQMLAYSGKGRFMIRRIGLAEVVGEMRQMLLVSVGKNIHLRAEFATDTPTVEVDVTQLRQVVLNLVVNASDALGDQPGEITVSTGLMHCDRTYLSGSWIDDELPEGPYAFLEVQDTGCGIAPEHLPRIFDPFFTTKFTGRGLGLAAVLGIVRSHRGALRVTSWVGHGTTFRIVLPVAGPPLALSVEPQPCAAAAWRGSGRVLLVDDEPDNRTIARLILRRLGFEVETAADGVEALEIVRARGESFRAVLLDLTMPRMDGCEAFREIRALRSDLPVVICSGYSEQDVYDRCGPQPPSGFIPKPYSLDCVRTALRAILGPTSTESGRS